MRVRYRHRIRSGEMDTSRVRPGDAVESPKGLGEVVAVHDAVVDVTARDAGERIYSTKIFTFPWEEVTIMLDPNDARVPASTYRASKFVVVGELFRQHHFEVAASLSAIEDRVYRLAQRDDALTPEDVAAPFRDYPIAIAQWAVPAVAEDVERVLGYRPQLESRQDVIVAMRALKNDMRMSINIAKDKGYGVDDIADLKIAMGSIDDAIERMEQIDDEEWAAVVEPLAMWRSDLPKQLKTLLPMPKPSSNPSSRIVEHAPERGPAPSTTLEPGDDEEDEPAPTEATSPASSSPMTTPYAHAIVDARQYQTKGSLNLVWAEVGMPVFTSTGTEAEIADVLPHAVKIKSRGSGTSTTAHTLRLQLQNGYQGPRVQLTPEEAKPILVSNKWLKMAAFEVTALSMNDIRKMVGPNSGSFAILTSWKDSLSKSMNQQLFGEFIGELQRMGARYEKLRGQYFGPDGKMVAEKSVLIFDIPKSDAQELAASFSQDSYIYKEPGDAPIGCYKTDGSGVWWARDEQGVLPASQAMQVAPRDSEHEDLWSKGPKGSLSFEFPIDFNKLEPLDEPVTKAAALVHDDPKNPKKVWVLRNEHGEKPSDVTFNSIPFIPSDEGGARRSVPRPDFDTEDQVSMEGVETEQCFASVDDMVEFYSPPTYRMYQRAGFAPEEVLASRVWESPSGQLKFEPKTSFWPWSQVNRSRGKKLSRDRAKLVSREERQMANDWEAFERDRQYGIDAKRPATIPTTEELRKELMYENRPGKELGDAVFKSAGAFEDIEYVGLKLVEDARLQARTLLATLEELAAFVPGVPVTPEDAEAAERFQAALRPLLPLLALRHRLDGVVAQAEAPRG